MALERLAEMKHQGSDGMRPLQRRALMDAHEVPHECWDEKKWYHEVALVFWNQETGFIF